MSQFNNQNDDERLQLLSNTATSLANNQTALMNQLSSVKSFANAVAGHLPYAPNGHLPASHLQHAPQGQTVPTPLPQQQFQPQQQIHPQQQFQPPSVHTGAGSGFQHHYPSLQPDQLHGMIKDLESGEIHFCSR